MPTYEYVCTAEGHRFEVFQRIGEEPVSACPECGGGVRKVFSPVGVVLKGSGFYKTDSRKKSEPAKAEKKEPAKKDAAASASEGSSEKKTQGKKKESA